jgi:hypothetical protein
MGSTPKPVKPPSKSDAQVQEESAAEARRQRQSKGRKSTQLQDLYNTFGGA